MSDYLDSYIDQKSRAQQTFVGNDGTPDDAQRSFQLEQASGVPAEVINHDVDSFDKNFKAKLGGQIVAQNPHLTSFVNEHPLHGQLIADDLSTLDNLTRSMERLNGKHAAEAGFEGFRERFGKDRIGSLYTSAIGGTKSLENYPVLSSIGASVGIPLEVLSRTVSGGVGFLHEFTKQYAKDQGVGDQAADKFANDFASMAEYELMKPGEKAPEFQPREDLRYNRETGQYGPAEGEVLPPEPKPQGPGGVGAAQTIEGEASPTDMTRRGFLQGLGATAAAVATKKVPQLPSGVSKLVENIAIDHMFDVDTVAGGSFAVPPESAIRVLQAKARGFREFVDRGQPPGTSDWSGIFEDYKKFAEAYDQAANLVQSGWQPDMIRALARKQIERIRTNLEAGEAPPQKSSEVFDQLEQQDTVQSRKMLDESFDLAEQTSLKQEAPDKLRELLNRIPNGSLRIPVEQLQKIWKPGTGDMFRNMVPDLEQRLQVPFGNVTFPTNEFVAHVPKDIYDALADDIAVGRGLSTNEAKEAQEIVQRPLPPDRSGPAGEAQKVGDFIASEMQRLGREPEEAQRLGQLAAARYYARGVRSGVSPRELFEGENLRFGEGIEGRELHQDFKVTEGEGVNRLLQNLQEFAQDAIDRGKFNDANTLINQLFDASNDEKQRLYQMLREMVDRPEVEPFRRAIGSQIDKLDDIVNDLSGQLNRAREPEPPSEPTTPTAVERGAARGLRVVKQGQRARITFGPLQTTIEMFGSANASSPIHEFGHLWTDELFRDAMRPAAPDNVINSRDALLRALGHPAGSIVDSLHLTDADHEQIAKWFEQYIREGDAPSNKLVGVFEQFKRDLTDIYDSAAALGTPISDSVRRVFDKMLATDEEIRQRTRMDDAALQALRESGGLSLNIMGYPWAEELPWGQGQILDQMWRAKAPWEQLAENPLIKEFAQRQVEMRKTAPNKDTTADPKWRAERRYVIDGKEYKGDEVIPKLIEKCEEAAGGPVAHDKIFTMVIGPPAAGKSTAINPLAKATRSAYVGSDDIKDIIPEYKGGVGVMAIHAESTQIAIEVLNRLMAKGTNVIFEKVGNNYEDIIPQDIARIKAAGYQFHLVHVHAPIEELAPRVIERFLRTGRYVDLHYINSIADKTYIGYQEMKPYADQAAAFSTAGKSYGQSPDVVDGADTQIAATVLGTGNAANGAGNVPRSLPSGTERSFGQPNDEPPRVFQRAAAFGRTEREYRRYQELIAQQDAEDVAWRRNRAEKQAKLENSQEWKAEADKIRDGIKAEVEQRPEVGVYQVFEGGRMKLAKDSLTEAQIAALPPKFVSKRGLHPDDVANFFGFSDGGAMVQVLSSMAQAAEGFKGDIVKRLTEAEVFKQVKDKLGETPQQRLEEVTDHALSLTEMEKLHEQVLALGQRMGVELPISKAAMQWGARELLMQDNFGGMKSGNYLRESGKASRALEKALLSDDPLEAFKQAQAQFVAANMAKEAMSVEREKRAFDHVVKRFGKREVSGVSAEYTNWIHDIMMRTGGGVGRSRADLNDAIAAAPDSNFRDFLATKYGMGYEIDVPDFLLDPNFSKPLTSMSVMEARQVMRAVQMLAKAGRAEKKIQVGASKIEVVDFLDQASEALSKIGEAQQLDWKGPYSAIRKVGRTFLASSLQIESLLNRFDRGNRFGIFNQYVGRPLFEAANYEAKIDRDIGGKFKELPELKDLNKVVPNPLFRDPLSALQKDGTMDWSQGRLLQLTRKNLLSILLNAGNTDNLERLATGYGLKPQQVMDWLTDNTTKADWDWAQKHGRIFESLKVLSDQMRRRLTGQAPESVPLFPIQNKFGTFDGWYHPIIHDENFFGRYRGDEGGNALFAKEYIRAGTPEGYTKARTNYRGPLSLSMDAIPGRIYQEVHDIAFREAIVNASKIVYNNRFLNHVAKFYGKEYADLFQPWLKDVANSANSNSSANQVFETASGFMRQNLIGTLVGLNPRTLQKHTLTALALSMKEVGPQEFSEAFFSLLSRGERDTQTNWSFALEHSEELQRRHQNFNEQVAGAQQSAIRSTAAGAFMSYRQALLHASTAPIAFFDLLSAVPTWLAAYKQALAERGNIGDATYAADTAVRRAHGSTAITNRPAIMRGGEVGNWMTSLYTFFNRMANAQYELAWRAKIAAGYAEGTDAEIREAMQKDSHLWMGLFVYVIAPAVIEEMVTPYTNAERESWGLAAAKVIGHGLASSWVGVRDFVSAFIEGKDPTLGMAGTEAKSYTDLIRDVRKKDWGMDRERAGKTIKHAITAFGAATGLTNAEMGNVAEFLYDLKTGKAKPRTAGDWWRGLTKGETHQKEERPDLVERGLRLVGGKK